MSLAPARVVLVDTVREQLANYEEHANALRLQRDALAAYNVDTDDDPMSQAEHRMLTRHIDTLTTLIMRTKALLLELT